MKKIILLTPLLILFACSSSRKNQPKNFDPQGLNKIIGQLPLLSLPWKHDLIRGDESFAYATDENSSDTLFFPQMAYLVGLLPDTSVAYSIVYYLPGDDLVPFITSFDKSGKRMGAQVLTYSGCAGCGCECDSCASVVTLDGQLHLEISDFLQTTECDADGNKVPGTTKKQYRSQIGRILSSGEIKMGNIETRTE